MATGRPRRLMTVTDLDERCVSVLAQWPNCRCELIAGHDGLHECRHGGQRRTWRPGGASREWRLELGECTPLSLNGPRGNHYAHARAVKAMRRLAWARAEEAKIPRLGRVSIELHYAPRDKRRRDPFNLIATLKPCEDGIVDAGVIPDDTPAYSQPTVPVIHEPTGRRGRMWLIIRELEVDHA